jgi:hypothetical protein
MIDQMGDLLNSSGMPGATGGIWAVYLTAGVAFVVGLALWLVGGRAMRPALGAIGMAAGAGVGLVIGEGSAGAVNTWIATGVGALAGLLFGLIMFRLTMSLTLGAVLGVLAPLATATLIHFYGSPLDGAPAPENPDGTEKTELRSLFLDDVPIVEGLEQARELSEKGRAVLAQKAEEDSTTGQAAAQIGKFAGALGEELQPLWDEMPVRDRMLLVLSMVTGAAMGMAVGMILPKSAAALIAAGAGAGMWLTSGTWLATSTGVVEAGALPKRAVVWLGVWGVLWVGGALFQFLILGGKKRESAE